MTPRTTPISQLLTIFLVLVPTVYGLLPLNNIGFHDGSRVAQTILLAVIAMCTIKSLPIEGEKRFAGVLGLMGLIACLSAIYSADRPAAFKEMSLVFGCIGVSIAVGRARFHDCSQWLARASALAMLLYGGLLLSIAALSRINKVPLYMEQLFVGYDNYRFFNHAQTVALPLAAIALMDKTKLFAAAAWLSLAIGFSLMAYSVARGSIVGLLVGIVFVFLVTGRPALPFLIRFVASAICGALLSTVIADPAIPTEREFGATGSVQARYYLWELAISYVREAPWVGIGPMHFAHRVNSEAAHPHNVYLQIAAEFGVPMLLLVLAMVAYGVYSMIVRMINNSDPTEVFAGCGLLIACIAALTDGFFSGNFVMPVSQVWIAAMAGMAISWTRDRTRMEPAHPTVTKASLIRHWVFITILLTSQIFLVYTTAKELLQLDFLLNAADNKTLARGSSPRFWSNGWF